MPQKEKDPFTPAWNPENVFSGTAWYYARYRPGYPGEVIDLLRNKFGLTKGSRVLDLGCGTGQIALKLAPYVSGIVAVDPQQDMLREGKRAALSCGISNVSWLKGESGKLADMASRIGKVRLTVIARAFHWMDREQTLADLFKMTQPGGGVAIVVDNGPTTNGEMLPWKEAIQRTVKKWLGDERKAGTEGTFKHPERPFEEYLKESEFRDFEVAGYRIARSWSLDEIIGYVYSTSQASLPVLGDKKELFEADLRNLLLKIQPDGKFNEQVAVNVMMVWKIKQRGDYEKSG